MTQAQRKADVEPHRMRYDLGGKTMTLIAGRRNIGGGFGLMPLNIAAHVKATPPTAYLIVTCKCAAIRLITKQRRHARWPDRIRAKRHPLD